MKTCTNCDCDLPTLADEYGPPATPVCWECHMGIRPLREPDGLDEARRAVAKALCKSRDLAQEAEGLRDEADELEAAADEVRREIGKQFGLDWPAIMVIERALGWKGDDVDWTKLPPLKVGGEPAAPADLAALPLFGVAA